MLAGKRIVLGVTGGIAAYKAVDKAMKRGVIKGNTAARKKSRLARLIRPVS